MVEKIGKRLDGWKKAYISKRGKLTLVQSVLASISLNFMSLFRLSMRVFIRIEKMMRDFLWVSSKEGKKDL